MPPLKPLRGKQLNKTHPLSRRLDLCWLFNECAGDELFDLSGNGRAGVFKGTPSWTAGRFGSALYFDGVDDHVETNVTVIDSVPVSVSLWFNADELPSTRAADETLFIQRHVGSPYYSFRVLIDDASDRILMLVYNSSGATGVIISSDTIIQAGLWYHAVFILDSDYGARMYVNGVQQTATGNSGSLYNANNVMRFGSRTGTVDNFVGRLDLITIFNRSLSDSEVALLNRNPFVLLESPRSIRWIPSFSKVAGSTGAQSAASGTLRSFSYPTATKSAWLKEALFNGMTCNAFKLGTTLSMGWFWQRKAGCSALYRGPGMDLIDFTDVSAVVPRNADFISPPDYVPHDCNTTYFYVVRRFNSCGCMERTLGAAAKVAIDAGGGLLDPRPNKVFAARAERTEGDRVRLTWFYCLLDQESKPVCFNVYGNNGIGSIDYQTPLASIGYRGRRYYSFRSDILSPGKYLFAVKAEDAAGVESSSSDQLALQVKTASPDPIEIMSAGCL